MNSKEFFDQAVSAAGLQGPVDQDNFYSHLRRWLKARHCTLVLTERGTVFAITKKDAEARVKHCKAMLQKYRSDVRNFSSVGLLPAHQRRCYPRPLHHLFQAQVL